MCNFQIAGFVFICGSFLVFAFEPYRPASSSCIDEAYARILNYDDSMWIPGCRFDWQRMNYAWQIEQCDKIGRCWCVNQDGSPMFSYGYHYKETVDCSKSLTCYRTMVYQTCGGCIRSCKYRHTWLPCLDECRQGCTCPPNTFWHRGSCVTADKCPPISIFTYPRVRATNAPTTTTTTTATTTPQVPSCNDTMVYKTCGGCIRTCNQRGLNMPCSGCKKGCTCPDNTYLHEGRCITEDQCPHQCPENQVYSFCAGCDYRCEDRNTFVPCTLVCRQKCTCPFGMYLLGEKCVKREDCPIVRPRVISQVVTTKSTTKTPTTATILTTMLYTTQSSTTIPPSTPTFTTTPATASSTTSSASAIESTETTPTIQSSSRTKAPAIRSFSIKATLATNLSSTAQTNSTVTSTLTTSTLNKTLGCNASLNEMERLCAPPCDPTCSEPRRQCSLLESCNFRCACADGQVRDEYGACVNTSQCLQSDAGAILGPCEANRIPEIKCDKHGFFNTTQCTDNDCYCADRYSGKEMGGTRRPKYGFALPCSNLGDCPGFMEFSSCSTACPPTCENPTPRCTRQCALDCQCTNGYIRVSQTNHTCVPKTACPVLEPSCREDLGEVYSTCAPSCDSTCDEPLRSCSLIRSCTSRCTCPSGMTRNKTGSCVSFHQCSPAEPSEDLPLTNCQYQRQSQRGLQDASPPDCDAEGLYVSKQCNGFLLECWCVEQITGTELLGSRAPQFNPTYSIDCDNYDEPAHLIPPPPPPPAEEFTKDEETFEGIPPPPPPPPGSK